jgi:hypothetical protein
MLAMGSTPFFHKRKGKGTRRRRNIEVANLRP